MAGVKSDFVFLELVIVVLIILFVLEGPEVFELFFYLSFKASEFFVKGVLRIVLFRLNLIAEGVVVLPHTQKFRIGFEFVLKRVVNCSLKGLVIKEELLRRQGIVGRPK